MVLDLIALDDSSKVWVYQSKNLIEDKILEEVRQDLYIFLEQWTSHNASLYTYGNIFHHRFLAIFVDERFAGASGCSIDKSVRFIESLESKYNLSLMERTDVAYMIKAEDEYGEDISEVKILPLHELKIANQEGLINANTLVFDNLVKNKKEFLASWIKPIHLSWHKRFI
ncbi:MAG: hypothetical protein IPM42_18735 [Saprospiraceae bacterium]|nr:hypothetical protein [Saprospiraceae bacterium]